MGTIAARLAREAIEPPASLVAAEVGVRRIPVPAEVIMVGVYWYLRYNLSHRDVEELLVQRGVEANHVTSARASSCGCNPNGSPSGRRCADKASTCRSPPAATRSPQRTATAAPGPPPRQRQPASDPRP
jgi:hypothetical protein